MADVSVETGVWLAGLKKIEGLKCKHCNWGESNFIGHRCVRRKVKKV